MVDLSSALLLVLRLVPPLGCRLIRLCAGFLLVFLLVCFLPGGLLRDLLSGRLLRSLFDGLLPGCLLGYLLSGRLLGRLLHGPLLRGGLARLLGGGPLRRRFLLSGCALLSRRLFLRRLLRSEEHTSELQSLMRISYAVFCLKKKHNN